MRRFLVLLIGACLLSVPALAQVPGSDGSDSQEVCPSDALSQARTLVHQTYRLKRYNKHPVVGPQTSTQLATLRVCMGPNDTKTLSKYHDKKKDLLSLYRRYRKAAPYAGFKGEGLWLTYLAVPRYIVSCETNGYSGEGRWHARNASGAQGPAQLLGWPAPNPAVTPEEKVRYWEVTQDVWQESGAGAWACA